MLSLELKRGELGISWSKALSISFKRWIISIEIDIYDENGQGPFDLAHRNCFNSRVTCCR